MRRILATILLFAAVICLPTTAFAHASLLASNPTAGATLTALPQDVRLEFDTNLDAALVSVVIKAGTMAAPGVEVVALGSRTTGAASSLDFVLPAGTVQPADGPYLMYWRSYSLDGHTMEGFIPFSIQAVSTPTTDTVLDASPTLGSPASTLPPTTASDATNAPTAEGNHPEFSAWTSWARSLSRTLLLVGSAMLAGAWYWRRQKLGEALDRRSAPVWGRVHAIGSCLTSVAAGAAAAAAVATALDVGMYAPRQLSAVTTSAPVFVFVLVSAFAAWTYRERVLALPTVLLAAFAVATTSHAIEQSWRWVSVLFAATHWLSVVAWIGPLTALAWLRQTSGTGSHPGLPTVLLPALRRYSQWAYTAVALAVISGSRQAIAIAGGVPDGRWGAVLAVKLALTASAVVPFGVFHHLAIRSAAKGAGRAPMLRNSLLYELVGVAAVALAAAVLAGTNPG